MEEYTIFDGLVKVHVDWEYAIAVSETLDNPGEENRLPISGNAAVRILAEYAAIAHRCAWAPEGTRLAVVVSPPYVWFCPSKDGLHGAFIEEYSVEKHGAGLSYLKSDLFCYTNIDARLDGWNFNASMVMSSIERQMGLQSENGGNHAN